MPHFANSILTYVVIITNETGDVVLNDSTRATTYFFKPVIICIPYNVSITANKDGYTKTDYITMYPNG